MNLNEIKISKSGGMTWREMEISWGLRLKKRASASPARLDLDASEMKNFAHKAEKDRITCVWKGHEAFGKKFEVRVIWRTDGELLFGNMEWKGGVESEVIEEARFPVVVAPMPSDASIFNAHGQGRLYRVGSLSVEDGRPLLDRSLGNIATLSMQWSALTSPAGSYYFDTRDTEFHAKAYEYLSLGSGSKFCHAGIHPLPLDGESNLRYKIPYGSSIGVFSGDWFEAALTYKKWARDQKWAARPPVDERLRDIGMWVWNRGLAEDVAPPVEKLGRDSGVPVALDWYWWHKDAYDTSYPFYWPPREGTATFKKTVARLKKQGVFTQVYVNGMTWDMDAAHWRKGGEKSAVTNEDGKIKAVMFNIFAKRRLAWMCGHDNKPFRRIISETVGKLRKAGLSGVYLDMIGCASNECCHNKRHTHAPGGGNHQTRGYREMLKDILKKNPGLPLSTEEPSEAYMDLFDSNISLSGGAERLWGGVCEAVPAFSAVYHGITAMFGNYALPDSIPPFDPKWPRHSAWKKEKAWHKLYPDQFFAEVARAVVWGLQPTVANLRRKHTIDPEFKESYDFLVRTARFYHSHRDFLFDGEMLPPGRLETKEIEVAFLTRFIFTKEGKETTLRKKMPAVLRSLWRAPDGRLGLVLANYTRETREFEFKSPEMKVSGKIFPRSWMFIEGFVDEQNIKTNTEGEN